MADVEEDRCEAFGLDPKRVASITRRLARAAAAAQALGLTVFGGSGTGTLRYNRGPGGAGSVNNVVAHIGPGFDGGDGGDE